VNRWKTDIDRVFDAVRKGAVTSLEVSLDTGIPLATASAWLSRLGQMGLIVKDGLTPSRDHRTGKRFNRWVISASN
jgi:hypothetical protein